MNVHVGSSEWNSNKGPQTTDTVQTFRSKYKLKIIIIDLDYLVNKVEN